MKMTSAFLGFCAGLVATACVILVARRFGFMYRPQLNRWNKREVALHGGIGVGLAFCVTAVWMGHSFFGKDEYLLLALPLVMLITGFIDDIWGLMPLPKLVMEISVALIAIYYGFVFYFSGNIFIDGLITAFWIVGIINSANMLDNIDGATAGILIISLLGMLLVFSGASPGICLITESLCGVLLGFLVFNFNPAKIFLGDSGSLFLGCIVSLMGIKFSGLFSDQTIFTADPDHFIFVVLIFAVCILDTCFVVINRKLNGFSAMNGDRGHVAHRLAVVFKNDKPAVVAIYAYQIIVIALIYWGMLLLLVPLFVLTVYFLYLLTIRTNYSVWPEKYSVDPPLKPCSRSLQIRKTS
jgi:UDP-GlcNAc:undecaprenyl-phosphate/decaprenyl-phosphate GlcNAc-1-phosphate transferase